jgi:thioredoxin 1
VIKYLAVLMVIVALIAGGCISSRQQVQDRPDAVMGSVDEALDRGPVFIEFGASWCYWCGQEKPVIDQLKTEYPGVTFLDVDTGVNGSLADSFYVNGIPQMNIIVKKNADGSYLYVDAGGNATTDRKRSAIIGYTEKGPLEMALNGAVKASR